jgi:hypothetical protein
MSIVMDNEVPEPIEAEQTEKTCPNYSAEVEDADFDYDARALVVPRVSYQKGLTQERREHKADHYTKPTAQETITARAAFRNGWKRGTQPSVTSQGRVRIGKKEVCTVKSLLGYLTNAKLGAKELKLYAKVVKRYDMRTGERVALHPYRRVRIKEWAIDSSWLRSFVSHAVNSTTPLLETSERKPRYFRNGVGSDSKWLVCHCCNTASPRVPWAQGYATPQSKVERLRVKLLDLPKPVRTQWVWFDTFTWWNRPCKPEGKHHGTQRVSVQERPGLPYNKPLGWTAPPDWTLLRVWTVPPETPEHERREIVESLRVLTSKTMNLCHSDRVRFSEYNCRAWFPWFILPESDQYNYVNQKWDAVYVSPWRDVPQGTAQASADAFDLHEYLPVRWQPWGAVPSVRLSPQWFSWWGVKWRKKK